MCSSTAEGQREMKCFTPLLNHLSSLEGLALVFLDPLNDTGRIYTRKKLQHLLDVTLSLSQSRTFTFLITMKLAHRKLKRDKVYTGVVDMQQIRTFRF